MKIWRNLNAWIAQTRTQRRAMWWPNIYLTSDIWISIWDIFHCLYCFFNRKCTNKKIERKTPHWIPHCDSCNIYVLKILYRWNMKNRNIAQSIEHTYILIYGLISAQIEFIYGPFLPFAAAVTLFKRSTAISMMAKCVVIFFPFRNRKLSIISKSFYWISFKSFKPRQGFTSPMRIEWISKNIKTRRV